MRQTRRIVIGTLLFAAVVGIVVWVALRPREPVYEGKRLSKWLPDINDDMPDATREKAGDAIRHMGTNTLPYLLRDLNPRKKSTLEVRLLMLAAKPSLVNLDLRTQDERTREALWALKALGPLAKPILPELMALMDKNLYYVPGALTSVGVEAIPYLSQALTNQTNMMLRANAAGYLAVGVYEHTIPASKAKVALPLLLKNLRDPNAIVRRDAVDAITALGPYGEAAVPVLLELLRDEDASVRNGAGTALKQVDPVAAYDAGLR